MPEPRMNFNEKLPEAPMNKEQELRSLLGSSRYDNFLSVLNALELKEGEEQKNKTIDGVLTQLRLYKNKPEKIKETFDQIMEMADSHNLLDPVEKFKNDIRNAYTDKKKNN